MSGYFINFIVYTAAMVGIIFIAVLVYKKSMETAGHTSKSKFLGVEDTISLAPRKTLYVVRAGRERFLVAADTEKTTLISKLDEEMPLNRHEERKSSVDDLPSILDFPKSKKDNTVFKNIASKMNM